MPAKKTKNAAKKPVVKAAPVIEHKCECGENCHCHCHGRAHWIKHIIVWAIIFALGMVAGKLVCCGGHPGPKHMPKQHPVFVEGCLDIQSVDRPKLKEKLMTADANGDNCISVEEYKAIRKEMRKDMRGPKNAPRKFPEPREPKMAD